MNTMISVKKLFVAAALFMGMSLQSMADTANNIWVRALACPSAGGTVYVDFGLDDVDPQSMSEFKRSINIGASSAFIYTETNSGYLFAGVARDMDRDGKYDAAKDKQVHVWYNYFFTAFYDHTDYFGQSTTEAIGAAEAALKLMKEPTDQVLAIFTKGAVAKRAVDEEAFGYVFSSKLDNAPGDEVTFYAYGDCDSRKTPNVYYKFDSWLNEQGDTISHNRELKVTVKGMETYYAHFEKTTKKDYEENERVPDEFRFSYDNGDFDPDQLGVETVSAGKRGSSVVYDLQGRRMAQPGKGLYIQNGRKLLVR